MTTSEKNVHDYAPGDRVRYAGSQTTGTITTTKTGSGTVIVAWDDPSATPLSQYNWHLNLERIAL